MSIEEAILEKVRALPPARRSEVLEYASTLDSSVCKPFRDPEGFVAGLNSRPSLSELKPALKARPAGALSFAEVKERLLSMVRESDAERDRIAEEEARLGLSFE